MFYSITIIILFSTSTRDIIIIIITMFFIYLIYSFYPGPRITFPHGHDDEGLLLRIKKDWRAVILWKRVTAQDKRKNGSE